MRLIDADSFFNDFPEIRDYEYPSQEYEVDAVEVVRCKDCIYYDEGYCIEQLGTSTDNGEAFCSWGERREE